LAGGGTLCRPDRPFGIETWQQALLKWHEARPVTTGLRGEADQRRRRALGRPRREVVRQPGAVAIVAIDGDGRITFVRQLREPARKRLLELPAGTREPDEEPLATAKLIDEAGLGGGEWRLAATFFSTPGFCDELVSVYVAEGVEETERHPRRTRRSSSSGLPWASSSR